MTLKPDNTLDIRQSAACVRFSSTRRRMVTKYDRLIGRVYTPKRPPRFAIYVRRTRTFRNSTRKRAAGNSYRMDDWNDFGITTVNRLERPESSKALGGHSLSTYSIRVKTNENAYNVAPGRRIRRRGPHAVQPPGLFPERRRKKLKTVGVSVRQQTRHALKKIKGNVPAADEKIPGDLFRSRPAYIFNKRLSAFRNNCYEPPRPPPGERCSYEFSTGSTTATGLRERTYGCVWTGGFYV